MVLVKWVLNCNVAHEKGKFSWFVFEGYWYGYDLWDKFDLFLFLFFHFDFNMYSGQLVRLNFFV